MVSSAATGGTTSGELHGAFAALQLQAGGSSRVTGANASSSGTLDPREKCPICHTGRYLRPDMTFMINPECYHKMCDSCVDRLFSHGPAPCPVKGCRKTLRKNKFRKPIFEDLSLEKEVDIRRMVAQVFNRREEEFESLRAFKDYEEEVEEICFNLANNINVEEMMGKVQSYKESHQDLIKENAELERLGRQHEQERQEAEKERTRLRREAALREEEEAREELEQIRSEYMKKLEAGEGDAKQIALETERELARRREARKMALDRQFEESAPEYTITGVRRRAAEEPEPLYDPFDGDSPDKDRVQIPQDKTIWKDYLGKLATDPTYTAGGYSILEFYARALIESVSGLEVNVAMERAGGGGLLMEDPSNRAKGDDVF